MTDRYRRSGELLQRALRSIPLGCQTFSKSTAQFPAGVAPQFLSHGRGARVVDVDGNEYVDVVCGLAAVSLGYCDPDVDRAVREQLGRGVTFSLSHPLEVEVAERVIELVPCAEAVRFGKNGSDVTAAAIRLARAVTGRELVAVCGYHGWQDWFIGATSRSRGVPAATRAMVRTFRYNDLCGFERLLGEGEFAAVILEPMNAVAPAPGFLAGVAAACRRHGAVLIFDEMVTGFRFALGGAQELFGVTPDLATFGKGVANGFPLALLTGRQELMAELSEVFFSTTFGGETLSLAAANAVLAKLQREPVLASIAAQGRALLARVEACIGAHGLAEFVTTSGHPAWSFLRFDQGAADDPDALKTLFLQECIGRGVLTLGTHNLCHAFGSAELERLVAVYDVVFSTLRAAIDAGDVRGRLRCEVVRPAFRMRPADDS